MKSFYHSGCHQLKTTAAYALANVITSNGWVLFCFLQLKMPQIQKIMMEFEKQSEIMNMKEEMMNDAIDDAMGDEDDEEER